MFCYDTPIRCSVTVLCFRNLFWRSASALRIGVLLRSPCYDVLLRCSIIEMALRFDALCRHPVLLLYYGALCWCSAMRLCYIVVFPLPVTVLCYGAPLWCTVSMFYYRCHALMLCYEMIYNEPTYVRTRCTNPTHDKPDTQT